MVRDVPSFVAATEAARAATGAGPPITAAETGSPSTTAVR
jgi:hypothetical protein